MSDFVEMVGSLLVAGIMFVVLLGVLATLYGADTSTVSGIVDTAVSLIVRVGIIGILAAVVLTIFSELTQ